MSTKIKTFPELLFVVALWAFMVWLITLVKFTVILTAGLLIFDGSEMVCRNDYATVEYVYPIRPFACYLGGNND